MKLFFNKIRTEISIADKDALENWLNDTVESKKGKIKPSAIFVGDISKTGFKLELKQITFNAFRPIIYGQISDKKIEIKLGIGQQAFVFLGIGHLLILMSIIKSGNWTFVIAAVIWTFFWYVIGSFLFTLEKRKTMESIEKIKKVCA